MKIVSRILIFILFFALFFTVAYTRYSSWIAASVRHVATGENQMLFSHAVLGQDGFVYALGHNDENELWLVRVDPSRQRFESQTRLTGLPADFQVDRMHITREGQALLSLLASDGDGFFGLYFAADGHDFELILEKDRGSVFSGVSEYDGQLSFFVALDSYIEQYFFNAQASRLIAMNTHDAEGRVVAGLVSKDQGVYAATSEELVFFDGSGNAARLPSDKLFTRFWQHGDGFAFIDGASGDLVAFRSGEYETLLDAYDFPGNAGHITALHASDAGILAFEDYRKLYMGSANGEFAEMTDQLSMPAWRSLGLLLLGFLGLSLLALGFTAFIANVRKMYLPIAVKGLLVSGLLAYWAVMVVFAIFINPEYIGNRREYSQNMLLRYVRDAVREGAMGEQETIPGYDNIYLYFLRQEPGGKRIVFSNDDAYREGFVTSIPGSLGLLLENVDVGEGIITSFTADTEVYAAFSWSDERLLVAVADGRFVEDGAKAFLDRLRFNIFALAFGIVLVCAISLWSVARGVRKITKGVDAFARGDHEAVVSVGSSDELGVLARSIERLTGSFLGRLAGDDRRSMSYLQFIPRQLVSLMGASEIEEIHKGTTASRDLTMMVVQFRFPEEAYRKEAKALFDDINEVTQRISVAVERNYGTIYSFTYNGCDAVFPEGQLSAVRAAVEMRQKTIAFNQEREAAGQDAVILRVAIDKGAVVMGVIGDEARIVPTAISRHLNTARMLAALCETLDANILCTAEIADADKESIVRYIGKTLDGDAALRVYEIVDGDDEQIRNIKQNTRKQFSEGVLSLHGHDYTAAKRVFMDMSRRYGGDGAVRYYLYLADRLEKEGGGEVFITP